MRHRRHVRIGCALLAATALAACPSAGAIRHDREPAAAAGTGSGGAADRDGALDAACTPGVRVELEDADPARARRFLDAVDHDPQAYLQDIGRRVCRILYRRASEVRHATHLTLLVRHAPGEVAWKSGDGADITVMISTDHLALVEGAGRSVRDEVAGVLFHEMTHMYQHDDSDGGGVDGGLIEGIADFVRIRAGYTPFRKRPDANGTWNAGYTATAFFLHWVDDRYPGFVHRLNLSMDSSDGRRWSPAAFADITGAAVDVLWSAYRDSLAAGPASGAGAGAHSGRVPSTATRP